MGKLFPHPVTVGTASGHNANHLYSGEDAIASVYGVPLHTRTDDSCLTEARWAEDGVEESDNAEFIARACNSHDDLVAALASAECAVDQLCTGQDPANECWNTLRAIRSALAKARGEA